MNNTLVKKKSRGKGLKGRWVILVLFIFAAVMAWKNFGLEEKKINTEEYVEWNNESTMDDMVDLKPAEGKAVEEINTEAKDIEEEEETVEVMSDKFQSEVAVEERLDVALISQLPELYNGCEVTSLAMLLNYKGLWVSKMELADSMIKDDTAVVQDDYGNIIMWGNPSVGFVGDVTGNSIGFSINPEPLIPLVNQYYPEGALNLTGCDIEELKYSISNGNPVLVWINGSFILPIEYMYWKDSVGNEVCANINTHTVLLTGYDEDNFYYNDPFGGWKDAAINLQTFETVWVEMGRKALTVN